MSADPSSKEAPKEDSSATMAAARPSEPLRLKPGRRLKHGQRTGTVEYVRGGWSKPYDVLIRWEQDKYPQWVLFRTLELDYAEGRVQIEE